MERHTAEANINTPVAASPHVYRAVQEHEFTRILLLHPSADRDSPLRCDLTHCTATNFLCEAISYAWGPPDLTASLFCGPENAEIRITPSLESALRAFRLPSETRRLWADAVCINQHDLDEKIVQVRRMSTIYRRAQHVRVWLGDEADDSNEAMRLFHLHEAKLIWLGDQILAKPPGDLQLGGVVEESDPWYTKNLDNVEIADEVRSLFSRRGEVAVRKLLARPWFGRRWVIQEVGLAQQASIHCGGASMDSKRLIACADVLEVVYRLHEPVVSTVVASILDGLRALHAAVRAGCLAKKPLVEWMDKFYASQCSDDRDRVYALMGLGGDTEGRLADAQHGLASLRYQSRVEQVYAALAVHTLKKHRKVGMAFLLSVATSFQSRDLPGSNVPTWVPDWRAPSRQGTEWILSQRPMRLIGRSALSGAPVWELLGESSISLGGWKYSIITRREPAIPAPTLPLMLPDQLLISDVLNRWWRFYNENPPPMGSDGSLHRGLDNLRQMDMRCAFLRCAARNYIRTWGFNLDDILEALNSALRSPRPDIDSGQTNSGSPAPDPSKAAESTTHEVGGFSERPASKPDRHAWLYNNLGRILHRRSLYVDDRSRVMNCPDDAEVGDIIVLLPRARVPYIIRPTNDPGESESKSFKLIGDAFVPEVAGRKIPVAELGDPEWFTLT